MSAEENKALFRRAYEELWNRGNLSVAEELIAPDFINHAASAVYTLPLTQEYDVIVTCPPERRVRA